MRKELINSVTIIKSTTKKYQYSVEVLTYSKVDFHLHWFDEMDCTAYETKEAAAADLVRTARIWNWTIEDVRIEAHDGRVETVVKHHRNKVKG